jgi:hypothetical protein
MIVIKKLKVTFQSTKAFKGNKGTAPLVLNLVATCDGSTSRCGLFTARKEPRCILNKKLVGPQNGSGRFGSKHF